MAWVVWGIGVFAYAVAVMHRGALGVAGLEAAAHFGTTAGVVSTFVVLQLAVYAVAQVPVGAMLDRFGSRAVARYAVSGPARRAHPGRLPERPKGADCKSAAQAS